MSAPEIKGWCPGALRPMASGDGWVVRVRARGGWLTGAALGRIADLARRFGNGQVDLSSRANLQLRGVTPLTHAPLIAGLRDLGLIDESPEAEARRNILVAPFWVPGDGTAALASALAAALRAGPDLPGKFGYAIDTGAARVLADASADIRIERDVAGGLMLRADGAECGVPVTPEDGVAQVMALARWFVATGGIRDGRGRMAAHLARGAMLPPEFAGRVRPMPAAPVPAPGLCPAGVLVALAFGQTDAGILADLAARVGAVRLTPWRMLLLEGVGAAPDLAGLICDPDDPLLRVTACTGAPGCPQARGPTRGLARMLAPHLSGATRLHVSGCAKGCAHPGACDVTLTATARGYDLIRRGRAADTPARMGLTADALSAQPELMHESSDAPQL